MYYICIHYMKKNHSCGVMVLFFKMTTILVDSYFRILMTVKFSVVAVVPPIHTYKYNVKIRVIYFDCSNII